MHDLLVALGLVLVIEGLIWAVAPDTGRRLLEIASQMPNRSLQIAGWSAVALGMAIVWLRQLSAKGCYLREDAQPLKRL